MHDGTSASTFSEDCNLVLISTKQMDVILYPFKRKALIV